MTSIWGGVMRGRHHGSASVYTTIFSHWEECWVHSVHAATTDQQSLHNVGHLYPS